MRKVVCRLWIIFVREKRDSHISVIEKRFVDWKGINGTRKMKGDCKIGINSLDYNAQMLIQLDCLGQ